MTQAPLSTRSLQWLLCGSSLVALVLGCRPAEREELDIVSRTVITGTVNESPVEGSISATIETGRGGRSTCEFSQLPPEFTPGTLGTHA